MSSSVPAAAVGAVLLAGGAAEAAPAKYTHAQAAAELKKAGISWTSSGNCSNWNRSTCTSFTNINKATIAGVIAFKKTSGCAVVITGGTEVGHSSGTYSHRNGYKLDISLKNSCVNTYISKKHKKTGTRGDGATLYKSPAGNVYAKEGNHWDITYYRGKA